MSTNEAETRAEHIDPALKAAGWGVADGSRIPGHDERVVSRQFFRCAQPRS